MAVRILTCVVHPDGEFAHLRRSVHNWVLFTGSDTPIDAGMVRVRCWQTCCFVYTIEHRIGCNAEGLSNLPY